MYIKIGICVLLLLLVGVIMADIKGILPRSKEAGASDGDKIKEAWKQVDKALEDGLPQTAEKILRRIHSLALEQNDWGEALHALSRRIACQGHVAGNKPAEKITLLKTEIETAPVEMRPLMKLMLTQWYWQYYQRNRWRFLNRSATAQLDDADFTTWDLPRLFTEISTLFQGVLSQEAALKSQPVKPYIATLDPGNMPIEWRSTLYDFAAWMALEFYTSAEQAGARPENAFEFSADSPALDDLDAFMNWDIKTDDAESPTYRALRLYQDLLRFLEKNEEAQADADLHRLQFVRSAATGEGASERYVSALRNIFKKLGRKSLASQTAYLLAREMLNNDDAVAALAWSEKGLDVEKTGRGGHNCTALKEQILQKEIEVETPAVQLPGIPLSFTVRYKNVDSLVIRVVKEDLSVVLNAANPQYEHVYLDDAAQKRLISAEAEAQWQVELQPSRDYRLQSRTIQGPALPPGLYRVITSLRPDFKSEHNKLATSLFQVSGLALFHRSGRLTDSKDGKGSDEQLEGFVTDGRNGLPQGGVKLTLYNYDYNSRHYLKVREGRSSDDGHFAMPRQNNENYRMLLAEDPRLGTLIQTGIHNGYPGDSSMIRDRVVFFTDRSIYRPGQTVHFKGIMLQPDEKGEACLPSMNRPIHVELRDVNDQKVADLDLTSNDFGSFSGRFTAPADRLTGQMSLLSTWSRDRVYFRVEEYKRPKFEVKVKLPEREFRLGQSVTVDGEAVSYSGAPIDGALVTYRVTRRASVPRWWSWFYPNLGQTQEIAHGRVKSDVAGRFQIEFTARPDLKIKPETQPIFTYQVSADVTDATGETRSNACDLRLGYAALAGDLSVPDWIEGGEDIRLGVRLTTHNGQPLTGKGLIEIHALDGPVKPEAPDLSGSESAGDWQRWPLGEKTVQKEFAVTRTSEPCPVIFKLAAGAYRARMTTQDVHGTPVEALAFLLVHDPKASFFNLPIPFYAEARSTRVEVGDRFEALVGTGYERGSVLVEVLRSNRLLRRYWTNPDQTQSRLLMPVTPDLRGGFTVQLSFIQEQRFYQRQIRVDVPWSNKALTLSWQTFRSKLLPGQKETWALEIKGPDAEKRAAELVATLYDESLDQFLPHSFAGLYGFFRQENSFLPSQFSNRSTTLSVFHSSLNPYFDFFTERYLRFPGFITEDFFGYDMGLRREKGRTMLAMAAGVAESEAVPAPPAAQGVSDTVLGGVSGTARPEEPVKKPDLDAVAARKNLNETAFFFPQLRSDDQGVVKLEFTMPEALTRWHFIGLAHTQSLEYGMLEGHVITQKELMVQPNPPRFLREGDELAFTVKVSNLGEKEAKGVVKLTFFDPRTEKNQDALLSNLDIEKEFSILPKQSNTIAWTIRVPDGLSLLAYKAVAATSDHQDGEEGQFMVIPRRILVQEALPLWISRPGEKHFDFEKLMKSGQSDTLRHLGLTVQMTSNPAWYAVQALPTLMEYPYECSEQTFSRLYGNALARHIAGSDPKIRRVFDAWKGTEALQSNLEKNQELKSALLQESPWVLDAQRETGAKQRVGLLFDENHMNAEIGRTLEKLSAMQYNDGAWPWFPGGPRSDYITLVILTGFGRLQHLGVKGLEMEPARKACAYMDGWISEVHRRIVKNKNERKNNLSSTIALYLYGRSFFIKERPFSASAAKAAAYFQDQARQFWLQLDYRMSQAQLALALNRLGDPETAQKIMRSMKERSQVSEELGRYWGELELSWWWFRAPIETQALMIEAFAEVMDDGEAVEECKVWLLKQKQTQDWKTTKATADAVYGLLLRGEKLLASDKPVEVSLGGQVVQPEKVEIGTGFYEKRYSPAEIKPEMGQIVIKKSEPGIAWGGVHWQYLEDISKITPHAGNPLSLRKRLFVKRDTVKGPVIEPVKGPLEVGDLLVVRIELRSDRDMEFLHLKDHRGSGLEPVNVLSRYKFQDGLAYYESTKDTASHFFIDYLPKGTYVFEYNLRVVHRGRYQTGLSSIACMYAPEFNSHSESIALEVK